MMVVFKGRMFLGANVEQYWCLSDDSALFVFLRSGKKSGSCHINLLAFTFLILTVKTAEKFWIPVSQIHRSVLFGSKIQFKISISESGFPSEFTRLFKCSDINLQAQCIRIFCSSSGENVRNVSTANCFAFAGILHILCGGREQNRRRSHRGPKRVWPKPSAAWAARAAVFSGLCPTCITLWFWSVSDERGGWIAVDLSELKWQQFR